VTAFKNRALDSSFAAAYFPDVTVTDPDTRALVAVPPSVVTIGAYSLNDRVGHPWFAPAGFTRGALNTVSNSNVSLNRTNLDDLYDADINPIAQYPGRPLSIWGQKTLLAANSALDRVNVRRLLIDVRRKVRNVANTLLFEPNRAETLARFTNLVNPILQSVQEGQGVDRFKVIIDTTTTTQADVENNTIRGKIFLQPTRSIEFVALDFVVTNAGTTI
jgi:phage tail sheath protein FI